MTAFRWRVYLDATGSGLPVEKWPTFDDRDGPPEAIPPFPRIVVIAQPGTGERPVLHNESWWVYRRDLKAWKEHDIHGLLAELLERFSAIACVRQGANIAKPDFFAVYARARREAGLE